jgi:hypothetical protein
MSRIRNRTTTRRKTPSPSIFGCHKATWRTESYSFYGKKEFIQEKLPNLPVNLSEHRVFLQITQGDSTGNVKLYERNQDGNFTVTEWSPRQTSALIVAIDKVIMANKGVNCVGEQIKAALKQLLGKGHTIENVSAPVSVKAAFAHPVKEASGAFIRTVIIFAC